MSIFAPIPNNVPDERAPVDRIPAPSPLLTALTDMADAHERYIEDRFPDAVRINVNDADFAEALEMVQDEDGLTPAERRFLEYIESVAMAVCSLRLKKEQELAEQSDPFLQTR